MPHGSSRRDGPSSASSHKRDRPGTPSHPRASAWDLTRPATVGWRGARRVVAGATGYEHLTAPTTAADADVRVSVLGTDEKTEGMSGRVSEHIQRLTVVVSAVVQQGGPEFFGALPLTLQFLDAGHAEVMVHLLRYVVRGPCRSREGRDLLESKHAMSRRFEQDQPVGVIVAAVGGDLIAGAVTKTEELPVKLRQTAAIGGIESRVHQDGVGGHLGPPATASRPSSKHRPPSEGHARIGRTDGWLLACTP